MGIVVAKGSFSTDWNGYPTTIVAGELRESSDPLVAAYPEHFKPAEDKFNSSPPVEAATKAPGEKRQSAPRPKKQEKKSEKDD